MPSYPANEPVEKVLLTCESNVFGGLLTFPKHQIVDCGAFYEVTFFCISPKNLLGDFFYSLNVCFTWRHAVTLRWKRLLDFLHSSEK
jgi:hypothetical protein